MNANKGILVVDDEPKDMALINNELKAAGYQTVMAQNGAEALVALWEKEDIGVVVLDVRLPVINGLNIFEIIRKHFPDKKIIINSVLQNDQQRLLIYDADNYYEKSQDLSSLKEKIDNALNSSMKEALSKIDKRISKRIPVKVLATCEKDNQKVSPAYVYFHSYTKDLSPFGGRLIVSEDVKVGQIIRIALEIPAHYLPVLIDGEVVWSKDNEVGIKFLKLDSPRDEEKLKEFLKVD